MKKIILFVLCVVLFLSSIALVACDKDKPGDYSATVTEGQIDEYVAKMLTYVFTSDNSQSIVYANPDIFDFNDEKKGQRSWNFGTAAVKDFSCVFDFCLVEYASVEEANARADERYSAIERYGRYLLKIADNDFYQKVLNVRPNLNEMQKRLQDEMKNVVGNYSGEGEDASVIAARFMNKGETKLFTVAKLTANLSEIATDEEILLAYLFDETDETAKTEYEKIKSSATEYEEIGGQILILK